MTRANDCRLGVDEIVAVLKGTNLPTLVVEGVSDMEIFRDLEQICLETHLDILPVGSRPELFEVFARRSEFTQARVAFLADSDLFLWDGIPPGLEGIVFTSGYSIENDILSGGRALGCIGIKLSPKWDMAIKVLTHWFVSAVQRSKNGEKCSYTVHPSQVYDFLIGNIKQQCLPTLIDLDSLDPKAKFTLENPILCLRGHTLIDLLVEFLIQNRHRFRYSKKQLLQMDILGWRENDVLRGLVERIRI